MAGTKESGRRPSANRDESGRFGSGGDDGRVKVPSGDGPMSDDFPAELETVEQIRAASRWVWLQQCRGLVDARGADALNTTLKTALATIRTAHGLEEMDKLRDLVARMEAATGHARQRDDQGRHTSVAATTNTTTTLGRRLAPSDDKH